MEPATPPPFAVPFAQIPWPHNTSTETSEWRSHINALLKQELKLSLRMDVFDLQQACLGHISGLDPLASIVFDECQQGDVPAYNKHYRCWTR